MPKLINKIVDNLKHKPENYIVWDNQIKELGIRINSNGKNFILK